MSEDEIKQRLDQLAEFQSQRDMVMLEKQALINEIYTHEIKARMSEIEAEFANKIEVVTENITALEAEIKRAVVAHGASVKGSFFHAVFNKARVSWDTKFLDGYATSHPELLPYRKEGEPSVAIRAIVGK